MPARLTLKARCREAVALARDLLAPAPTFDLNAAIRQTAQAERFRTTMEMARRRGGWTLRRTLRTPARLRG
jgi:hypothetical protein